MQSLRPAPQRQSLFVRGLSGTAARSEEQSALWMLTEAEFRLSGLRSISMATILDRSLPVLSR
jgi:hypothetical protein